MGSGGWLDRSIVALCRDERVAMAFERLGALTLADKVDRVRSHGDVLAITLPLGPGQLRTHRIRVHRSGGRDHSVNSFYLGGWFGFEPPLPDVLVRAVRASDGCVFDVGANTGLYSLLAAEARPSVEVHAFEPFPPVIELLEANIAMNRARPRIRIVRGAADDRDGELVLHVPRDTGAIETSCSLDGTFKDDIADEIKVRTFTLDGYWSAEGRPKVSIVKIDTEGTEHRVLNGAHELVSHDRPVIFYEVLPRAAVFELRAFADRHGLVDIALSRHEAVIGREVGYDAEAWNHALVPDERVDLMRRVAADAGLVVTDLRSSR